MKTKELNSEKMKWDVVKWWHQGKDYKEGVKLIALISSNKTMVNTLIHKTATYGQKILDYQLPKAVNLNHMKMPSTQSIPEKYAPKPEPVTTHLHAQEPGKVHEGEILEAVAENEMEAYPKIIKKLKYLYSDLYTSRSMAHQQMAAVEEANTPINMQQRAAALDEIKAFTEKMGFYYNFILDFEKNGVIPDPEIVFPKVETNDLPDDVEELKKRKKNLQTSNTKDRNQLLYGQNNKAEKEFSMPPGVKRERIELRILEREKEIERIDRKLFEMEKNAG